MDAKKYIDTVGLRFVLDNIEIITPFAKGLLNNLCFYEDLEDLKEEMERIRFIGSLGIGKNTQAGIDSAFLSFKDIRRSVESLGKGIRLTIEELFELKILLMAMENLALIWKSKEEGYETDNNGEIKDTVFANGLILKDISEPLSILDPSGERKRCFMINDEASEELSDIRNRKRALEKQLFSNDESIRDRWNEICIEEDTEEKSQCLNICKALSPFAGRILENIKIIGHFELLLRKAQMEGTCIPSFEGDAIKLIEMHNPELETMVSGSGKKYIKSSINIEKGITVITGANMGGKSVALKTIALNVILAMTGFPVFCREAVIPDINEVFYVFGNYEDARKGLSAFAGEMTEIKETLDNVKENSLMILDEPAMGTNPKEGAAIVKGITEYLNKRKTYSIIVTHFDGVAPLAGRHYRINGFALKETGLNDIIPNEAVSVCRELGLDNELLKAIEKNLE